MTDKTIPAVRQVQLSQQTLWVGPSQPGQLQGVVTDLAEAICRLQQGECIPLQDGGTLIWQVKMHLTAGVELSDRPRADGSSGMG